MTIGMREYMPIHSLDQTARMNKGRQEYLVQTLQGFAWRSQTSSVMEKSFSIVVRAVIATKLQGFPLVILALQYC